MKSLANEADRKQLLERLQGLRPNSRRHWGKMSPHQMICHLTDSFKSGTGEKSVQVAESLINRTVLKWAGLYVPIPWPHGIKTRPEMDQNIGGTKPVEFEVDRVALAEIIERFSKTQRDFEWGRHPLFGKMSDRDWHRWGYLHVDHHLRQFGQ